MNETEQQFEKLISEVIDRNYGMCDDFMGGNLLDGLRANLLNFHEGGMMHPAGVGRHFDFTKNLEVRGDVIRWIEEDSTDPFERKLMDKISHFIRHLNTTCYTHLNQMEFHYAFYESGSFYKRHLDEVKSHRGRKFSLVIYLKEHWEESDGGDLRLSLDGEGGDNVFRVGGGA